MFHHHLQLLLQNIILPTHTHTPSHPHTLTHPPLQGLLRDVCGMETGELCLRPAQLQNQSVPLLTNFPQLRLQMSGGGGASSVSTATDKQTHLLFSSSSSLVLTMARRASLSSSGEKVWGPWAGWRGGRILDFEGSSVPTHQGVWSGEGWRGGEGGIEDHRCCRGSSLGFRL